MGGRGSGLGVITRRTGSTTHTGGRLGLSLWDARDSKGGGGTFGGEADFASGITDTGGNMCLFSVLLT